MSESPGNVQGSLAALYESLQTSVLQLFTDPTQLSPGQAVLVAASALFVGAVVWTCCGGQRRTKVKLRAEFTPGKIYYHVPPPVKAIPCLTPFGMKLETYLRMADIPYEPMYGRSMGPKGKIPWIEYNGEAMADSGLIMEFLNREKGVDLNRTLSDADKAVSRAFTKMVEENTYWGLVRNRWIDNFDQLQDLFELPWAVMFFLRSVRGKIRQTMWGHGLGRHSKDEQEGIIEKDLRAISSFLGTKPYLMGDEPTEVDAAVFGQLSELCWANHDSYLHRIVTVDCPNLQAYCSRIKDRYWSDWDQLTKKTKKDQ
ncbi:failed axon connections homolog isoform X2 [Branchiostoma floridae]|uniref:Failed axon connections homolog isoform X2 n=1 Tax=Branchiostoma floridae TaxID=7739 RepID=A0A9J7N757_BRAFL|nr:failed axon connections homolog isoform X2 [Branchiostoma floridae]